MSIYMPKVIFTKKILINKVKFKKLKPQKLLLIYFKENNNNYLGRFSKINMLSGTFKS